MHTCSKTDGNGATSSNPVRASCALTQKNHGRVDVRLGRPYLFSWTGPHDVAREAGMGDAREHHMGTQGLHVRRPSALRFLCLSTSARSEHERERSSHRLLRPPVARTQ